MARYRVQFVASEIFPLAKTGGLADVAGALPAALASMGADVRLVMPGYMEALDRAEGLRTVGRIDDLLGFDGARVLAGRMPDSGLPVSLVDIPALYRDGGGIYLRADGTDRDDNAVRFAALSHAAVEIAQGRAGSSWRPNVVHCNDWHTGLIPVLLRAETGSRPSTVFTIHNMAFQGQFPLDQFSAVGLPDLPGAYQALEFYGRGNLLKVGLQFADYLTAVSPTYAREIQTSDYGYGLEGVVAARADRLKGILNGIDAGLWTPAGNRWLAASYSERDLSGKRQCKRDLQRELGLIEDDSAPLMVFIGRLTWQKMADVMRDVLPQVLKREPDRQFALLGQGDRDIESGFRNLAMAFPGRVAVRIGYTEREAHRLHAGGDMLIHGSRYEPCGLTQLYAMRFGTPPIVRPVGGLADTVIHANDGTIADGTATGFHFWEATGQAKLEAIDDAIALYRRPLSWCRLQGAAMKTDFRWERSAREYLDVYDRLLPPDGMEARAIA